MSGSQAGKVMYGLITVIHLQRIAQSLSVQFPQHGCRDRNRLRSLHSPMMGATVYTQVRLS
jgi:hypothetical protein